jgi:GT2 family glycosyltransferase
MSDRMAHVAVSIVHYNTPELLRRCLSALVKEGSQLNTKLVVVDNASTPPLAPSDLVDFPGVELISNRVNVGFGAANNQVFKAVPAEIYVVINPDIIVSPGSFGVLYERLTSNQQLGVVGVRLRYPNGELQASCRRYPTLRSVLLRGLLSENCAARFSSIRRYLMMGETLREPTSVDWVLGSCLAMRRETVGAVGGFDEDYFMYYEDIDLCYRIKKTGLNIEYYPAIEWIHDYRRESTHSGRWHLRRRHFLSAMKFLKKHVHDRGVLQSV